MHKVISPAILYFGAPVVLLSTLNEDGSANLAPMSSAWWLRDRCMLGLDPTSKSTGNLVRTGECVLNLPAAGLVAQVDRLALLTGSDPLPPHKAARGYRHERDKFAAAGLTPIPSERVRPPRVLECAVHLEALLEGQWPMGDPADEGRGMPLALGVRIVRVHVEAGLVADGHPNRVDPERWRPLMMSFQQFYGLGPRLHPSRLGTIPEELYRRGAPVPGALTPGPTAAPSSRGGEASSQAADIRGASAKTTTSHRFHGFNGY
jgi:flavin reductase (DIM6/NTAB) family NADH-FMN oxidoreductase RutF